MDIDITQLMGCIIDRDAKERYWSTLPFNSIMSAAPEILTADDGADVFLFDAEAAYLKQLKDAGDPIPWVMIGDYLANHNQKSNDCTSHGSSGAVEDTQMVDIMWRGKAAEFQEIASEPLYGGAIVTIMQTRGDNGAYTHAPLDYGTKYGFIARKNYPDIGLDFTTYDVNKVKDYSRNGVPKSLLPIQAQHLIKTSVPIHSYEEGSALMRQGYAVFGGSTQGFTMTRDKDGFCRPSGRWPHCTRYRGRRGGKKPGWAYGQSWGPGMPGGPLTVTLDSGRELTMPEGTFFVDPDTINHMIGTGEFFAVSSLDNFATLDNKFF